MTGNERIPQPPTQVPCFRCHRVFESNAERTMHTIRKRCDEISTEEHVETADYLHSMDEVARSIMGHERAWEIYYNNYADEIDALPDTGSDQEDDR